MQRTRGQIQGTRLKIKGTACPVLALSLLWAASVLLGLRTEAYAQTKGADVPKPQAGLTQALDPGAQQDAAIAEALTQAKAVMDAAQGLSATLVEARARFAGLEQRYRTLEQRLEEVQAALAAKDLEIDNTLLPTIAGLKRRLEDLTGERDSLFAALLAARTEVNAEMKPRLADLTRQRDRAVTELKLAQAELSKAESALKSASFDRESYEDQLEQARATAERSLKPALAQAEQRIKQLESEHEALQGDLQRLRAESEQNRIVLQQERDAARASADKVALALAQAQQRLDMEVSPQLESLTSEVTLLTDERQQLLVEIEAKTAEIEQTYKPLVARIIRENEALSSQLMSAQDQLAEIEKAKQAAPVSSPQAPQACQEAMQRYSPLISASLALFVGAELTAAKPEDLQPIARDSAVVDFLLNDMRIAWLRQQPMPVLAKLRYEGGKSAIVQGLQSEMNIWFKARDLDLVTTRLKPSADDCGVYMCTDGHLGQRTRAAAIYIHNADSGFFPGMRLAPIAARLELAPMALLQGACGATTPLPF